MDIFSHTLWTGLAFRKSKKIFWPIFFGVAPDIFSNGLFVFISVFGGIPFLDISRQHLNSSQPSYVPLIYSITHSLIFFAAAFLLVWLFLKKPWWPLGAWGLHIVADIPFHSAKFFATPFLFPLSSWRVNSISWNDTYILLINFSILAAAYLFIYFKKEKKKAAIKEIDWRGQDRKRKKIK